MHARVLTVQVRPGKMDEVIRIAEDSMAPILKRQQGFKLYLGLTECRTGKGLAVSLWEVEADERAWEIDSSYHQLAAKFMPLISGAPTVERYEVSVQL